MGAMELVCPAGGLPALKAAIDNGADWVYLGLRDLVPMERFTAYALAFSGGTFLHLSLSDILPDLHRRGGSKWRLTGALLAGLALMWALRFIRHGH